MSHFTRTRADLAAWQAQKTLSSSEINDLDSKTFRAVNGDEGGFWAPTAQIVIEGAGLTHPEYESLLADFTALESSLLTNFVYDGDTASTSIDDMLVYDPATISWYAFGVISDNVSVRRSLNYGRTWTTPAGSGFGGANIVTVKAAHVGNGVIVVATDPNAATAVKLFGTTDNFATVSPFTVATNSTDPINGITYWPEQDLWLTIDGVGIIESSSDLVTWAVRESTGAALTQIARSPTKAVAAGAGSHLFTSDDGISWNAPVTPPTGVSAPFRLVYHAPSTEFLLIDAINGKLWVGLQDGEDWISINIPTLGAVTMIPGIVQLGDLIMVTSDLSQRVSSDAGRTWKTFNPIPHGSTLLGCIAQGGNQVMALDVDGKTYASIRGRL